MTTTRDMLARLPELAAEALITWGGACYNESGAGGAGNTLRRLTHSTSFAPKEGLAMDATQLETWKPIPGYEGQYEASNIGRVRSLDRVAIHKNGFRQRIRGRMLVVVHNKSGYATVSLCRDGKARRVVIHRLVLEAFVGPKPPGQVTRHLNGDKLDNRLENLTYGTYSENAQDAVRHGTFNMLTGDSCKRGHPWSEESTYWRKGRRTCRICMKERGERRYRARVAREGEFWRKGA